MIILKIQGGLGNQMFQYAAGRNLSISLDTEIKLDITSYNNDVKREYELKHFSIKDIHANESEIALWRITTNLSLSPLFCVDIFLTLVKLMIILLTKS